MSEPLLKFYAVRNKEGKYFRAKGYGGYGETWVDDIKKAKIYSKPGGARGVITWFYNNYPEYGVPDLIELGVTDVVILNEEKRVLKSAKKKEIEERKRRLKNLEYQIKIKASGIDENKKN